MPKSPTKTQQIAFLIEQMMPFCPPAQQARATELLQGAPFVRPKPIPRGELFSKLLWEAKSACMDRHGPLYMFGSLHPTAGRWGRLAKAQASYKSEKGVTIRMPRDHFIPAAEFWPGGVIPRGVELCEYQQTYHTGPITPYERPWKFAKPTKAKITEAEMDVLEERAMAA